jgi:uncharacterized protein YjbJ (UPF0337 family)
MSQARNQTFYRGVIAAIFPKRRSETMNWDRVEGNWKQFKGKAQQQWGKLTDDDLDAGKLQARYGYAKDEAEKNIDTWLNTIN